jgi:hypothetical protein
MASTKQKKQNNPLLTRWADLTTPPGVFSFNTILLIPARVGAAKFAKGGSI